MTHDPRDPLQQRREAMTAWERGLRPPADRHWLLWLAIAALLVFIVWRGAEWLLAHQRTARPRSSPPVVSLPIVPAPVQPHAPPDTANRPAPKAESYGVTKCLSATGKAEYSDGPCPTGSRATTVWVQPDMNLAEGMSRAEREASMRENSTVAAQTQQYEQRVAQNTGNALGECAALDAHIKWIDAMARQPQSAWRQDELSRDRKESRDRQFRLRCR